MGTSHDTKHHQQKTYVIVLFYTVICLFLLCAIGFWIWSRRRNIVPLNVTEEANEDDDDEALSEHSQEDEEAPNASGEAKSASTSQQAKEIDTPRPKQAAKHGESISFRCWFLMCECLSLAGATCTNCLEILLACWIVTGQACCSRKEEHIRVYDQPSSRHHRRRLSRDDKDDVDHHAFYVDRPVAEPTLQYMSPTKCREPQTNNYWCTRLTANQLQNLGRPAMTPTADPRVLAAQSPVRIAVRHVDPALDYAHYHGNTMTSPRSPIILRDQKARSPSRWHYEKNGCLPVRPLYPAAAARDPTSHAGRQRSLPPLPPSYYYPAYGGDTTRPTSPYSLDDRCRPHSYRW